MLGIYYLYFFIFLSRTKINQKDNYENQETMPHHFTYAKCKHTNVFVDAGRTSDTSLITSSLVLYHVSDTPDAPVSGDTHGLIMLCKCMLLQSCMTLNCTMCITEV